MTQNNAKPVVSKSKWISSVREFRSTRVVVFCGMMCALAIVLNYTSTIRIGDYIRIGFSGIPNRVVDFLFGPFVGAVFGGALDIIKYFLTPTGGFFPGFTLTAMLGGVIHGYILYRRRPTLARVFAAQLPVKVLLNCGLNTLWLQMLYGQGFMAILPGRIVSNAVMLPVDTLLYYIILQAVDRYIRPRFLEG